jgi:hypothetical protein
MKVRVLRSAFDDLAAGRQFYDRQEEGVGQYFFDSLFSDIDSLVLYAGIHRIQFGYQRMLACGEVFYMHDFAIELMVNG